MSKLFQDNEEISVSSLFIVSVEVKPVKILIPKALSVRELLYLARDEMRCTKNLLYKVLT